MTKLLYTSVCIFIALCHVPMLVSAKPEDAGPPPREANIQCGDLVWIGSDTFQIFTESSQKKTWEGAKNFCETVYQQRFGITGRLAVLSNSSYAEDVRNHLKNSERFSQSNVEGYWIGCNTTADGSGFSWLDGTDASGDSLWLDGQPDNAMCSSSSETSGEVTAGTMTTEGCCQLWNDDEAADDQFKMDDACCADRSQFICEFPDSKAVIGPDTCDSANGPRRPRCPAELTVDDKGIIQWPSSKSGLVVQRKCPFSQGNGKRASRTCMSIVGGGAEWGEADTSDCTPQSQVSRGNRLNHLANTTIPRGQAKKISKQLTELTTDAEDFEESDMALSVDVVGNIVDSGENGTDVDVAEDVLKSMDNLVKVGRGVLKASQKNGNAASRLIKAIERLSLIVALPDESTDTGNDTVTIMIETPNIAMTVAGIDSESFSGLKFKFASGKAKLSEDSEPDEPAEEGGSSIELPTSVLDGLDPSERSQAKRVQFVIHKSNSFFEAIDDATSSEFSPVVAASIGELKIANLKDKIKIRLEHLDQNDGKRPPNVGCVFWDFNLKDGDGGWSTEGCTPSLETKDSVNVTVCECNHLTNFALIDDVNRINSANQNVISMTVYLVCGLSLLLLAMMSG